MTEPQASSPAGPFDTLDVIKAEGSEVRARRTSQSIDDLRERDEAAAAERTRAQGKAAAGPEAHSPRHLVGLALSGGGIRSATFNLGLLQAMNREGLLRMFDYVSTVSGGGYVGGWWSAWLARDMNRQSLPSRLFPEAEDIEPRRYAADGQSVRRDPDAVHHLRTFSNYLTPRSGLFSPDVWRAAVVIVRNLALTWAILLPLVAIVVMVAQAALLALAPHLATGFYSELPLTQAQVQARALAALLPSAALLGWFASLSLVWLMLHRGTSGAQRAVLTMALVLIAAICGRTLNGQLPPVVLAWAGVAVALGMAAAWPSKDASKGVASYEQRRNRLTRYQGVLLASSAATAVVFVAAAFGHEIVKYALHAEGTWQEQLTGWSTRAGGVMAAVSSVHTWLVGAPKGGGEERTSQRSAASRWLLAAAPALTMATLLAVIAFLVNEAVIRLDANSSLRDSVAWVFNATTLVGVALTIVLAASESPGAARPIVWGPSAAALLATLAGGFFNDWRLHAAAIALGVGGVALAAWRVRIAVDDDGRRSDYLLAAASVSVAVVSALTLAIVGVASTVSVLLGAAAFLATVMVALGWSVDPNNLSLHLFYKSRLVRAYLGASNPHRGSANEDITKSIPHDNVELRSLAKGADGAPYHLVNVTLNLAAGEDVTMAQRRAANFVLSRLHCGSGRTGYRPTDRYMGGTLSLGTAIAVSGAAASPNMGSQTPSTALAMLMALLNVRLGFWAPTPNREDWEAPQARLWPFYLMREFFSRTTDQREYCYLTDGGHFDNTGLYSLVERGCHFIVAADCGADPDTVFDDVSNAIRRCRIDFKTEFTFPSVDPVTRAMPTARRARFVVGRITYAPEHLQALGWTAEQIKNPALGVGTGVIVLVKPTLREELDLDVRRYSQLSGDFPQETTADQWYDEAQFESYRRLGEKSAHDVFGSLAAVAALKAIGGGATVTTDQIAAVFQELWSGVAPAAPPAQPRGSGSATP